MTTQIETINYRFEITASWYIVLTFIFGLGLLFNQYAASTAGAFMGWSLFCALIKYHITNHPTGQVAQLLQRL